MIEVKGLGRRVPEDWDHYAKFPLTAAALPSMPVPVVIGVNWYSDFDNPVLKSGRYWIGLNPNSLGHVRGGHCVALEPGDQTTAAGAVIRKLQDSDGWWDFYDQGNEGACVAFGGSRMMSMLNRKRYYARWLWDMAKMSDEWTDTNPGDDNGTSVRAALDILTKFGHVPWKSSFESQDFLERDKVSAVASEGISVYRWASTVDQVREVLKSPANDRVGGVRILNSWGRYYPHRVWMPYETLQVLIDQDGEVGLVTDR